MRRHFKTIASVAVTVAVTVAALTACGPKEPASEGGTPEMRRLTEEQYRNTVGDLFGPTITFGGRFDPLARTDGLIQLGARTARVTPSGFEQYYTLARSIAAQVVDEEHRETLISCTPADPKTADDACARKFYAQVGRLLYRRPLTDDEIKTPTVAAHDVATSMQNFYNGLAYGLAGMMVGPKFLFVMENTEADPDRKGEVRLNADARASRLSFLLWNSMPDDMLLTAASKGELFTKEGVKRQVDRMVASPKLEGGVRAFFTDFLDLRKFETLEKDPVIYPSFNVKAGEDAKEQILRTIADHVVTRELDYRDLFITRHTFVTAALARIYRIPAGRPDGGWTAYEFAESGPRAGLVAQIGFLAVNSHPGRSSPTIRGRAVREVLLCQKVPDPLSNVDFSLFNDPNSPHRTARQRLTAHAVTPACAGCHKITDPIGLGLENFDGSGALRNMENGEAIDASGDVDGIAFKDAKGLEKALRDSPAVPTCLVNRLYAYALGRPIESGDKNAVAYFQEAFAKDDYRVPALLRRLTASDAFFKVRLPKSEAATQARATDGLSAKDTPS